MNDKVESVEKFNAKNPLESVAKAAADAEIKALNEQLKKEYGEVNAAKKVLGNAVEKALDTNSKIKELQGRKPLDLASIANALGV